MADTKEEKMVEQLILKWLPQKIWFELNAEPQAEKGKMFAPWWCISHYFPDEESFRLFKEVLDKEKLNKRRPLFKNCPYIHRRRHNSGGIGRPVGENVTQPKWLLVDITGEKPETTGSTPGIMEHFFLFLIFFHIFLHAYLYMQQIS